MQGPNEVRINIHIDSAVLLQYQQPPKICLRSTDL
jgi:hypothetical protein